MQARPRDYYLNLRQAFTPQKLRLIILAESPPASGKYFYDISGRTTEPLFVALMRDVLDFRPGSKEEGLLQFQKRGLILVDATYLPVNQDYTDKQRNELILNDYPALTADLLNLAPSREVPLFLVKANICRLLEPKLVEDGFSVLNRGSMVPFPSTGHQPRFRERVRELLPPL
jgi:hypothetical protein